MQHFGVPTRLLDWSRDALVALFFATNPEDRSLIRGIDASVWVANPVTINKAYKFNEFTKAGYIPNVEEAGFNTLFGPDSLQLSIPKPAAAIGPLNSSRIGIFYFRIRMDLDHCNCSHPGRNRCKPITGSAIIIDGILKTVKTPQAAVLEGAVSVSLFLVVAVILYACSWKEMREARSHGSFRE